MSCLKAQEFPMKNNRFDFSPNWLRRKGVRLFQAAALALLLLLAIPARAGDGRAIKSRVAPVYPEIARRMKIVGEVKLEITVDAEGKVTDVKKVSGNSMLSVAADEAVRKWKFEPGAATSVLTVSVNFAVQ
jgi:TonB family protein